MRKYFLLFFFAFLFANILVLDAIVIQNNILPRRGITQTEKDIPAIIPSPALPKEQTAKVCDFGCPQACLNKINEATASLKTEKITSAPVVQTVTVVVTQPAVAIREYYVALGIGTGEGSDWKDVENSGMQVDLSEFNRVKNIYFEVAAYLRNDNVTGSVRLYNYTDKKPVENSEVTINKLKCQTATSVPISIPLASKNYRLQVKATLNATVYIDQARLRIVTE